MLTTAHLAVKPPLIITLYMRPHSSLSVTGRVRASHSLAAFEPYSHLAAFEPYSHLTAYEPSSIGRMRALHSWVTFSGHTLWAYISHSYGSHTLAIYIVSHTLAGQRCQRPRTLLRSLSLYRPEVTTTEHLAAKPLLTTLCLHSARGDNDRAPCCEASPSLQQG